MNSEMIAAELSRQMGADVLGAWLENGCRFVRLRRESLPAAATYLREGRGFDLLADLFGLDRSGLGEAGPRFEVVYNFYAVASKIRIFVKVPVEESDPTVPTLTNLYAGAGWFERELWDMYGIRAEGHPDLRRILLYEGFEGHPLRRDYPIDRRQPLVENG